jgi:hypothetical protein
MKILSLNYFGHSTYYSFIILFFIPQTKGMYKRMQKTNSTHLFCSTQILEGEDEEKEILLVFQPPSVEKQAEKITE